MNSNADATLVDWTKRANLYFSFLMQDREEELVVGKMTLTDEFFSRLKKGMTKRAFVKAYSQFLKEKGHHRWDDDEDYSLLCEDDWKDLFI